ncbi:oligosaccharide flippase family protein [Paenarthrobacter sp. UW852]|uniref:oligosaccharide flippase family protein n=1 Tax=Paenarthrobacter sp. UW852 TaxID=2951989 RepID=UPI0021493D10|nr:oligosaccharide flippase family protein [Paenarthrobacter sp. UW852]MCR1160104.1 oligosaccharide flippase family protein [Paenarthrobacter sp. UW852]
MTQTQQDLGQQVRHGLAWSSISNIVLRLGSLAVGIALARLLSPEQFGVFAVALTVQTVLMTMADLGMSADLIRSEEPDRKAPTIATLGVVAGTTLAAAMAFSAQGTAELLGSPAAGPVIAVMSGSLLLAGVGVVPYATLQRNFAQRKLFIVALVDFAVGTALVLLLIVLGWGVMALAVGRLISQALSLLVQFRLARTRFRFGFDKSVAPAVIAFGVPVAGANLLSWALLNVDNVAISRLAGPVALGFYFLAFNISTWPMSALGQVVRSVALPAFARLGSARRNGSFATLLGPVWTVALLAGLMLALLATPVIELVYGAPWLPAAAALVWLGLFSSLRVGFDLAASYLLAHGATRATLYVQVVWITALVPALTLGVAVGGIAGAAAAHLMVAFIVVGPAYAIALHRNGSDLGEAFRSVWPPCIAALPAAAAAMAATTPFDGPLEGLLAGAAAGTGTYVVLLWRWFYRRILKVRAILTDDGSGPVGVAPVPGPLAIKAKVRQQAIAQSPEAATVTVVITCYNYGRFLRQAAESALSQDGIETDVIVVDDASTDNSLDIALELAAASDRVMVLRHARNRGPVVSFNDGAAVARGEFLVRLDADDILTPGSLHRAVAVARAYPSVGLVYGHPLHFEAGQRPTPRLTVKAWTIWPGREWLRERCRSGVNVITSPEALIRRSVLQDIGYQTHLKHTHDMEMWFRIAAFADVAYIHGSDQAWHREHAESLSATGIDELEDLKARRDAFDALFTGPAAAIPEASEFKTQARRALANDALTRASHEFDRGRGAALQHEAFAALAAELVDNPKELKAWNRYDRRRALGPALASRPVWSVPPRVAGKIRHKVQMRRWHNSGVY